MTATISPMSGEISSADAGYSLSESAKMIGICKSYVHKLLKGNY